MPISVDELTDTVLAYRQGIIQREASLKEARAKIEALEGIVEAEQAKVVRLEKALEDAKTLQLATEGRSVVPSSGGSIIRPTPAAK